MSDTLYTKATINKKTENDFVAIASTATEDRHGEIVSVEGWDLKGFKNNPVLLWGHDHSQPAVGKANKVWIDGTGKRAKLMIEGIFSDATELGRSVKQLVSEGIIKTMSVGFRPIEMEGNTFTAQELLEVSFVNVPANPQAMISAYKSLNEAGVETKTMTDMGIQVDAVKELSDKLDKLDELEKKVNTLAKVPVKATASLGRYSIDLRNRQARLKVIARATDQLLQGEKTGLPKASRTKLAKTIKKANEDLIRSSKESINGKN